MTTALILSGGGAKGAFTVGALRQIKMTRPDIVYDIISGTSTGSLIASLVVLDKIDLLENIYTSVRNDDIIRQQDPAVILRKGQPFFFNDAPLVKMIKDNISEMDTQQIIKSPKTLFLTALNLQSGRITVFTNKNIPSTDFYDTRLINSRDMLINALRASSNQPVFLPPVTIKFNNKKEQFIDGGNREVIPCLAVMDQNPSKIFVISNNPKQIFPVNKTFTSVIDVLMRAISIFIQDVRENDLVALEAWRRNRGAEVSIHYIEPSQDLDPDFPTGLRFEPGRMGIMISQGKLRAKAVLEGMESSPRVLAPTAALSVNSGDGQCQAMTQQGPRCKNKVLDTTGFCHSHQNN